MYLHNLRGILADMYPDANDARRLADDAELNVSIINFNGPAENVWQDVLRQAVNEERIDELLQHAIDEFPTSSKLLMAAWTYKVDTEHIIAVSNGEYDDMNGNNNNGTASLYRRLDSLEARFSDMQAKVARIEVEVAVLMRSDSGSTALDTRTLMIAVAVAVVMFAALWAMRL